MSQRKKNSLVYLFSKTWQYSEGNRRNVILFWVMFLIASLIEGIYTPVVWAKVLDFVQNNGITTSSLPGLFWLLFLVLSSTVLFWAMHGPARVIENLNAFLVKTNYRKYLMKGVMTMPMEWQSEHHSGDTIDKINKGVDSLFDFAANSFEIIYAISKLLISFFMLVYLSSSSAVVIIVPTLVTMWVTMRFDRVLIGQYRELSRGENVISESVFDAVSNIATVIILRVEGLVFDSIIAKVERQLPLFTRSRKINEWKWFSTSLCTRVMIVIVMGLYFWQQSKAEGSVAIGTIYLVISYLRSVGDTYNGFAGIYSQTVVRQARVLNAEELAEDFVPENFTNHILPTDWRELSISNLTFSYKNETGQTVNLYDVALAIRRGERIAFVGETASGKTTLLRIIRNIYHAFGFTLKVDGKVMEGGFEGISRAIALVPQNPEIFSKTILGNITLGADHDLDFVRYFTDMACFTEVVERLPKKLDSMIKEKGVNLSGGEVQRLALSRGLLASHDKDIVLLDEPTSSLDFSNEMAVYTNIFRSFEGKTVISSIHRLHLLPMFDRVYMFEKGRIIGSGRLEELRQTCPQFEALWQKQYVDVV